MINSKLCKPGYLAALLILPVLIQLSGCNGQGSGQASGSDVNLSWIAPVEREDNRPISLSEIAGYKVYYGPAKDRYDNSVVINDGSADSYTVSNLAAGAYFFSMSTLDTEGRESHRSPPVRIVVQNS